MAFKEGLSRLDAAGLLLHLGPTKRGAVGGSIAKNVDLYPRRTVTKRPGYRRWLHIREDYPVSNLVRIGERFLIMAGDLDERDAS